MPADPLPIVIHVIILIAQEEERCSPVNYTRVPNSLFVVLQQTEYPNLHSPCYPSSL
jgi:hypothetical protein